MTLKWILSMAIIFVILFGITIAVSADESSADVIGLDQKQYLHKPPELPAELGIKIKDNLYSSELIEGATLRSSDVIHLYEGINFVSVPMPLADGYSTVEEVFGEISPGEVLGWNGTSWFIPSEDDEIVPLDGYVIIVEEEYDISLELDPNGIPPTKNLTGVNLIGFSDVNPATARDTLYCVHEDWSEVMGYDAETQQYETSILN